MNSSDEEYQVAVETEIKKISSGNLEQLKSLEPLTNHSFSDTDKQYKGTLIYFPSSIANKNYSVVLKLERKLFVGYRSFLAGFSFNDEGAVLPISEELLYSCD